MPRERNKLNFSPAPGGTSDISRRNYYERRKRVNVQHKGGRGKGVFSSSPTSQPFAVHFSSSILIKVSSFSLRRSLKKGAMFPVVVLNMEGKIAKELPHGQAPTFHISCQKVLEFLEATSGNFIKSDGFRFKSGESEGATSTLDQRSPGSIQDRCLRSWIFVVQRTSIRLHHEIFRG